jgi:hypothetical protein
MAEDLVTDVVRSGVTGVMLTTRRRHSMWSAAGHYPAFREARKAHIETTNLSAKRQETRSGQGTECER